jgi:predicted Zn-dependent peptidase
MQCERRRGPRGSRVRRRRPLIAVARAAGARLTGTLPRGPHGLLTLALLAALASCTGLPDVLQSPPANELAARAPEDAARHRRLAPGELERFRLPNGLTVVLLVDDALPKVVVDLWLDVGSKDEPSACSGFAQLFEHLMRVDRALEPDVALPPDGGSRCASTGLDLTRHVSTGPAALLQALLTYDASRLDRLTRLAQLDERVTRQVLERQRAIVRSARRQAMERVPYAKVGLLLPPALYPPEHPYHHPVTGSLADLEAASVEDVAAFFRALHVPANASLVVAGDFDPDTVRALIERTFGALAPGPARVRSGAPPAALADERQVVTGDRVAFPKLVLAWHSPPAFAPGDAELQLAATILAEGPASRLEQRLVLDLRLAQEVDACQLSAALGSVFVIEAVATPGADLEALERVILDELADLARDGPDAHELERARVRANARFRRRMESLVTRAEAVQAYLRAFGDPDGFERDLARWTDATRDGVRAAVRATFGPGRVDLRVLPELGREPAVLFRRPAALPEHASRGRGPERQPSDASSSRVIPTRSSSGPIRPCTASA